MNAKRLTLCVLIVWTGLTRTLSATLPGWGTDLDSALERATTHGRPVLAYFTASWCGPCKLMARTTLADETVTNALSVVDRVTVDIDEQQPLAARHDVRAVPTFIMLTPSGSEAGRVTGYQDAAQFTGWLSNGIARVEISMARQKVMDERLADVVRIIRGTDEASLKGATEFVMDLCAEEDAASQKAAAGLLDELAQKNPVLVLEGLNHPRLATRIIVANTLRARIGDAFDVDPWSDAATRRNSVAAWTETLSAKTTSGRSP